MKPIVPIDEPLFRLPVLHEAARLAHVDPAALTDLHLRHVALYSESDAVAYAIKRDRAIEAAERATAVAEYRTKAEVPLMTQAPIPAATGITAATLEAIIDGLVPAIKTLITRELEQERAARDKAVTALEHQLALLRQELTLEKRLRVVEQRTGMVTPADLSDETKRLQ